MTEQQIPMLMRLIMLMLALHQRQLKETPDLSEVISGSDVEEDTITTDKSWTGWIWRAASSILPADEQDENWNSDQQTGYRGHTLHTGVYIDHASFTFKVYNNIFLYIYDVDDVIFFRCRNIQMAKVIIRRVN